MNLNARIKRLEAIAAAKAQAQRERQEKALSEERLAQIAAMSDEELLAEYEAIKEDSTPIPELEGKSVDELIQMYFQLIQGKKPF